jgi:hypothetical protein
MEESGPMRSPVARRLSTLASFYRYCEQEQFVERNPALNVRRPKVDYESRTPGSGEDRAAREPSGTGLRHGPGLPVRPTHASGGVRCDPCSVWGWSAFSESNHERAG